MYSVAEKVPSLCRPYFLEDLKKCLEPRFYRSSKRGNRTLNLRFIETNTKIRLALCHNPENTANTTKQTKKQRANSTPFFNKTPSNSELLVNKNAEFMPSKISALL